MSLVGKVAKKKVAKKKASRASTSSSDVKSSSITDVKSSSLTEVRVQGSDTKWQDIKKTRAKSRTQPLKHLHQWGQPPPAPNQDAEKQASNIENAFRQGRWSDFVDLACRLWVENEKTQEFMARNVMPTIIQRYVGVASFTLMFDVYALAHNPTSIEKMARVIARAISGRQFALADDGPGPYFNMPCSSLSPIRHIEFVGVPTPISSATAPTTNAPTLNETTTPNLYESFAKWHAWISHNKLLFGPANPPSGTELYEIAFQTSELMKHLPPFTFFGSRRWAMMNSACEKATEREKEKARGRNHHSAHRSVCGDRWSTNLALFARVLRSFIIEGIGDRVLCVFLLLAISLSATKTGFHNRVGEMCEAADAKACRDLITLLEARLRQPQAVNSAEADVKMMASTSAATLTPIATSASTSAATLTPIATSAASVRLLAISVPLFRSHLPREDEVPAAWKQTPDWKNGPCETFFVREELARLSVRNRELFLPKPEKKKTPADVPKSAVAKTKRRKRLPTAEEKENKEITSYLDELDKIAFEEGKNLIRKASCARSGPTDIDAVQTDHAAVFPWTDPECGPSEETAALGLPHIILGGTHKAYLDEAHLWVGPFESNCVQSGVDASRAVFRARKMREWGIPVPAVAIMPVSGKPDRFWLRVESPFPVHRWAAATRGLQTNRLTLGIGDCGVIPHAEMVHMPPFEVKAEEIGGIGTKDKSDEGKESLAIDTPVYTEAKRSHMARVRWALENSPAQQLLAIQMARSLLGAADNGLKGEKAETLIIDMTGTAGTAKKADQGGGRWVLVVPLPITRRRVPSGYRQTFWNEWCQYGSEGKRTLFASISGVLFGRATRWRDLTAHNLRDLCTDVQWCRLAAERVRPLLQHMQITVGNPKKSDVIMRLLESAIPAIFKPTSNT